MTNELVEKYERSIRHLERQINKETSKSSSLISYHDYLNSSSNVAKKDVGVQVQMEPQISQQSGSEQPVVIVDDKALANMMNIIMNNFIRQQQAKREELEHAQLKKKLKDETNNKILPLPAPKKADHRDNKRKRSQSLMSFANDGEISSTGSDDSESSTSAQDESVRNKRRHSLSEDRAKQPETEDEQNREILPLSAIEMIESGALDREQLQQFYQSLRQEIQVLEERRIELQRKENELLERERFFDVATQPATHHSDLYSQSSIKNYRFEPIDVNDDDNAEQIKQVVPRLGFIDRVIDKLLGQSPDNCIALICSKCFSHNGLKMMEDAKNITRFKCWDCKTLNIYYPHSSSNNDDRHDTRQREAARKNKSPTQSTTAASLEQTSQTGTDGGTYQIVEPVGLSETTSS